MKSKHVISITAEDFRNMVNEYLSISGESLLPTDFVIQCCSTLPYTFSSKKNNIIHDDVMVEIKWEAP